jgi:hypothetical protein
MATVTPVREDPEKQQTHKGSNQLADKELFINRGGSPKKKKKAQKSPIGQKMSFTPKCNYHDGTKE